MTLEQQILERLAKLDDLHDRLQPKSTGASPRPPKPKWVEEVQKQNLFYNEVFGTRKGGSS